MTFLDTARISAALLVLLAATSCATIMEGSTSDIQITSTPEGAEFELSTGFKGQTPATVSVPNGTTVRVDAVHASYPGKARQATSVPSMSGWVAGNILTGIIGLAVDFSSSRAKAHKNDVHLDFETGYDPQPSGPSVLPATPVGTPTVTLQFLMGLPNELARFALVPIRQ